MLTDEEHSSLIESLRDHQARTTMRGPPSTAVHTAIRVLETSRVEMKQLIEENNRLKASVNNPPDALY
jgi:hypothetical protein